jgi:hypothetical protein
VARSPRQAHERSSAEARSEAIQRGPSPRRKSRARSREGSHLEGGTTTKEGASDASANHAKRRHASARCPNPRSRSRASAMTTRRTPRAERLPGLRTGRNLRRTEAQGRYPHETRRGGSRGTKRRGGAKPRGRCTAGGGKPGSSEARRKPSRRESLRLFMRRRAERLQGGGCGGCKPGARNASGKTPDVRTRT